MPDANWRRVTKPWTASYTPALSVTRGEPLTLGRTDPDNPGWRWATNEAGLGGWLPIALIDGDHLIQDFDSTELTVAKGDRVRLLKATAAWHLCATLDGRTGWLPETHIATAPIQPFSVSQISHGGPGV